MIVSPLLTRSSISSQVETSSAIAGNDNDNIDAINDVITADLGYRFMFIEEGKANYSGVTMKASNLQSHQIMLGFRVNF